MRDPEEPLRHLEEPGQDPGDREVGPQLLLADLVAVDPQLLAVVGQVPGLQVVPALVLAGEGPQLRQFLPRLVHRAFGQVAQEGQHLLGERAILVASERSA